MHNAILFVENFCTGVELRGGLFGKLISRNLSQCQVEGTPLETVGGVNEEVEKVVPLININFRNYRRLEKWLKKR